MAYVVICNPAAGRGKTRKWLRQLENYLVAKGVEFRLRITNTKGEATRFASEFSGGEDVLVCMGGDGTLHEVLNGLREPSAVRLGIIPCGTGNDFAKAIGLPLNSVEAAMQLILEEQALATDYISLNGIRSLNVSGMGIDVEVLERCERAKLIKGRIQYYLSLISSLIWLKWKHFTVCTDGVCHEHTAMITAVCNGNYIGGGMMISPESLVDDGKLHVVIVNKVPKRLMPRALISFFNGRLLELPFVSQYVCEQANFVTDSKPVLNADGELVRAERFDCSIVKAGIQIFRRRGADVGSKNRN